MDGTVTPVPTPTAGTGAQNRWGLRPEKLSVPVPGIRDLMGGRFPPDGEWVQSRSGMGAYCNDPDPGENNQELARNSDKDRKMTCQIACMQRIYLLYHGVRDCNPDLRGSGRGLQTSPPRLSGPSPRRNMIFTTSTRPLDGPRGRTATGAHQRLSRGRGPGGTDPLSRTLRPDPSTRFRRSQGTTPKGAEGRGHGYGGCYYVRKSGSPKGSWALTRR